MKWTAHIQGASVLLSLETSYNAVWKALLSYVFPPLKID